MNSQGLGNLFSLNQLVGDFRLLGTDGQPEWPFCILPTQAQPWMKDLRKHRCLPGLWGQGGPVAEPWDPHPRTAPKCSWNCPTCGF